MKTLRGLLLALPLFALLPGCPIYIDGGSRTCMDDFDCPAGRMCAAGSCVECVSTSDCPADHFCVDGSCREDRPRCTRDSECGAGSFCDDGTCREGSRSCRTHGDCDPGLICDEGLCTPSTRCTTDSECAATEWCDWRGTCAPREGCRDGRDCDAGSEVCIEGECIEVPGTCSTARDCSAAGSGNLCVNNECAPLCTDDTGCLAGDTCVSGTCRATTDCSTSASCASGEHCVTGRCLPDCSASSCGAGAYCGTDGFCHPSWQPEDFCRDDGDCVAGRSVCRGGVCRTPCTTMMDSQCMSIDAELPFCRENPEFTEWFCVADSTPPTPECRTQSDCGEGRDCRDGICRNR